MTGVTEDDPRQPLSTSVNDRATLAALEAAIVGVRARIERACDRAGRSPDDIRLIGVTKGVSADRLRAAVEAGLEELGENYVQDLVDKRATVPAARWHFIGRLQRNKAHRVAEVADVVQTLEPGAGTERLLRLAARRDRPLDVLVEVDFTGRRVGVEPEGLRGFLETCASDRVRLRGLMTVAPQGSDPRPWFRRLRELRDDVADLLEGPGELSMGMTADLEEAVEEGATMVRVGTAIFGPRARR